MERKNALLQTVLGGRKEKPEEKRMKASRVRPGMGKLRGHMDWD
jgi:hypothetical protein